jgi:hypothetical protein
MHAPDHPDIGMVPFRRLLEERIALVKRRWPTMTLMALGRATLQALGLDRSDGQFAFELPSDDRSIEEYGAISKAPILRFSVNVGGQSIPVYWRYVFSYNYRARPAGRHWLGKRLRAHVEGLCHSR